MEAFAPASRFHHLMQSYLQRSLHPILEHLCHLVKCFLFEYANHLEKTSYFK